MKTFTVFLLVCSSAHATLRYQFVTDDSLPHPNNAPPGLVLAYLDLPFLPATHEDLEGLCFTDAGAEFFAFESGPYSGAFDATHRPFQHDERLSGDVYGYWTDNEPPYEPGILFELGGSLLILSTSTSTDEFDPGWEWRKAQGLWHEVSAGDANMDGAVDARDLNQLGIHWQQDVAGWEQGDFTGDGFVDAQDLNELAVNWQSGVISPTAVPEPLIYRTVILCACLAVACMVRRRKRKT